MTAGAKASLTSDDVVVANSGTSLVHVKNGDPAGIRQIVTSCKQSWAHTLYTATKKPQDGRYVWASEGFVKPRGWVPGTFSLELIHPGHGSFSPWVSTEPHRRLVRTRPRRGVNHTAP